MKNIFAESIKTNSSSITYYTDQITLLATCASKFEDIEEIADVGNLSISKYGETTNLHFYLKSDKKDSKLVHKLSQIFGVKFEKVKSWDEKTLIAKGTSNDGLWYFEVSGYVPSTCTLVTEEIELTEQEIETARKNVATKKLVTKVICA